MLRITGCLFWLIAVAVLAVFMLGGAAEVVGSAAETVYAEEEAVEYACTDPHGDCDTVLTPDCEQHFTLEGDQPICPDCFKRLDPCNVCGDRRTDAGPGLTCPVCEESATQAAAGADNMNDGAVKSGSAAEAVYEPEELIDATVDHILERESMNAAMFEAAGFEHVDLTVIDLVDLWNRLF